jgi:hypothetical protein
MRLKLMNRGSGNGQGGVFFRVGKEMKILFSSVGLFTGLCFKASEISIATVKRRRGALV